MDTDYAHYVPMEKRTKKAQREHNAQQRGSWYGINPITRVVPNKKAYDRNRAKAAMRGLA